MRFSVRAKAALALAALFTAAGLPAAQAAYPDKPIHLIVSFPPGSGTDTTARYAAKYVASAAPDGYTILLASNSPVATNVAMFNSLPYDPVKDLDPVARLARGAMALAVSAGSSYKTVGELVQQMRAQPGKLNYGAGSASYQIATEPFLNMAGVKANHVPYKGAAPAITDLAGNQVDFVIADYGAVQPLAQGGKVRVLAVTGDKRLASEPKAPTLQESGYPDYFMVNWTAAFAPAKTPKDVIKTLADAPLEIYATPESAKFVAQTNWEVYTGGPEVLRKFQLDEIERWSKAAQRAGVPKE